MNVSPRVVGSHESQQYVLRRSADIMASDVVRTYGMLLTWACRRDGTRRALGIFSRNTSILYMSKILGVREKTGDLMIEENGSIDSSKRFYGRCDENHDARKCKNTMNLSIYLLVVSTQCHTKHSTCDIVKRCIHFLRAKYCPLDPIIRILCGVNQRW